jgi:hypothetical protein
LHQWVTTFEQMWNDRFDRLELVLAELSATDPARDPKEGTP